MTLIERSRFQRRRAQENGARHRQGKDAPLRFLLRHVRPTRHQCRRGPVRRHGAIGGRRAAQNIRCQRGFESEVLTRSKRRCEQAAILKRCFAALFRHNRPMTIRAHRCFFACCSRLPITARATRPLNTDHRAPRNAPLSKAEDAARADGRMAICATEYG